MISLPTSDNTITTINVPNIASPAMNVFADACAVESALYVNEQFIAELLNACPVDSSVIVPPLSPPS